MSVPHDTPRVIVLVTSISSRGLHSTVGACTDLMRRFADDNKKEEPWRSEMPYKPDRHLQPLVALK
jgi:hypothetical protein